MQSRAADQAGQFAVFGRMADKSRRFVDDQQFIVFKNDVKKFFQARKIATESQRRRENCGIMSMTEADGGDSAGF
jgi:hypothetical protein